VDDFLSALSLLTHPDQKFIRFVYYKKLDSGQVKEMPEDEVTKQMQSFRLEKEIDEVKWRSWAKDVLVGWEPSKGSKSLSN
jgi:hypothetical protein